MWSFIFLTLGQKKKKKCVFQVTGNFKIGTVGRKNIFILLKVFIWG